MRSRKNKHCAVSFKVEYGDKDICELISTDCVIFPNPAPLLGLPTNSDVTLLIVSLLKYLQDLDTGGGPIDDTTIYVEGELFRYRKGKDNLSEELEKGDVAYDGWYYDNTDNRWGHVVSMRYVGTNGTGLNNSLVTDWEIVADSWDTETEVNDYEDQINNGIDF